MKKIPLFLLFLSVQASAQTFPVNNLQINGVVSGNVSGTGNVLLQNNPTVTGSFTATGLVTTTDLATQAANTVLANGTGSTASPTAFPVPSCNATGNTLNWTSGTGFTCQTGLAPLNSPALTGTPTAPTAAAGTNNTQIATTAFVSNIVASHNTPCYSILDFGGDNTSTNNNDTAWTTTLSQGIAANRCIYFPSGKYKFAGNVSYTIPAGVSSVTILGAGSNTSILYWPSGGGISVNYNGTESSSHVQNLSITSGTTNVGTGLALNQAASVSNSGNSAASDITNVTIRGDDGYQGVDYWSTALSASVSNVNFTNAHFVSPNGSGNQVSLAGSSTQVPVIFNFANSYFEGGANQIIYGNYVQGVQVTNSNFVGGNAAIVSNAGELGLDQLTVMGSQFASNVYNILANTAIPNTVLMGNVFYVANNGFGLDLIGTDKFSIIGNMFPILTTGAGATGINIGATSVRGGEITGNNINGMGTVAIQINNGTQNVTTNDNVFNANGVNISNGSGSNTILDYAPVATTFGAVSLTSGTSANVGSVSLSPGIWLCTGVTQFTSSANNLSNIQEGISTTSATLPSFGSVISLTSGIMGGGTTLTSTQRISASSNPTTTYLVAQSSFASGTSTASGQITCTPTR